MDMAPARQPAGPKPNLLFLTQRLPYPPNKGEKIRTYRFLSHLTRSYTVDLGCLIDDPHDEQNIAPLQAICRDVHVARVNRRLARLTCMSGLLTNEALSVVYFRDRDLTNWVTELVARVRPAMIFVNSSNMAPYMLGLPRTGLRVVDLTDVDSEKWRAYADKAHGPMRWIYRREWRKVSELEHRIARECNLAMLVSDAEAALLARHFPDCADRIRGVSNGVDLQYFDPARTWPPAYDPAPPNFVFTGTMDYPPNMDAVDWFAHDVLPLIRRGLPDARFHIVGTNPAPQVQALADLPGVFVTGRVPDVRPYLAHATAAVAPMRIARGIQNKVLEAMAMARPVIVTPDALEGIDAAPNHEVLLAEDPAAFAAACCAMADTQAAASIGAAARRRVEADYDWAARLRIFDDIMHAAAVAAGRT